MGRLVIAPRLSDLSFNNVRDNGILLVSNVNFSSDNDVRVYAAAAASKPDITVLAGVYYSDGHYRGAMAYVSDESSGPSYRFAYVNPDNSRHNLGSGSFVRVSSTNVWIAMAEIGDNEGTPAIESFSSREEFIAAVVGWTPSQPITYRLTNCTAPDAPSSAEPGSVVVVPLVFSEGFGIVNSSDAYVMNNGVQVPAIWNPNDNTITFNMP